MTTSAPDLTPLLHDRLQLVAGEGGTGKTTVSAALALLHAHRGRKTVLCEVDNQRPSLPAIFGREVGLDPVTLGPNLDVVNLTWPGTLEIYLRRMVRIGRIVRSILDNDVIRRFMDFVPGSQELVTLSAIVDLVDQYDVVVVDMPASGHAFSLLDITRSALGLFRSGPVRGRVEVLREAIVAPTTRSILVALPEEMVVNETLETLGRLEQFELMGAPAIVVLNRALRPSLTDDERTLLDRLAALSPDLSPDGQEFVEAGLWERAREDAAAAAQARLAAVLPEGPALVAPAGAADPAPQVVQRVAVDLGRRVGVSRRDLEAFLAPLLGGGA